MSTLESIADQKSAPPIDEQVTKLLEMALSDDAAPAMDEQLLNRLPKARPEETTPKTPPASDAAPQSQALPPLASPARPRRGTVKRFIRPALGIGLLGLAAWALIPLFIDVRSKEAVVNAPMLTVCSPIDGTVTFLCGTESGANATTNAPLLEVKNSLASDDRLDTLKDDKTLLEARIESHRSQLAELASLQKSLTDAADKYRVARLRTLELERDGAKALLASAQSVEKQRDSEKGMLSRLQASHSVSKQDAAATQFASEAAQHTVVQSRKSVESLEEQLRALRDGIHVGPGDGRNDLPYSAQRLHEISFRTEEIRATLRQDEAKLAQLGRHIEAEKKRVALQSRFTAKALDNWVVWRRYVVNDATAKAGMPLLDMIDPTEIFVDAVISEKDLSRVRVGDTAQVRIAGSDRVWKAKVSQVVGRTLPWPDRLLAADAAPTSKQDAHVLLRFSEPLSNGEGTASLPVGLPAEVTFISTRDLLTSSLSHGDSESKR